MLNKLNEWIEDVIDDICDIVRLKLVLWKVWSLISS